MHSSVTNIEIPKLPLSSVNSKEKLEQSLPFKEKSVFSKYLTKIKKQKRFIQNPLNADIHNIGKISHLPQISVLMNKIDAKVEKSRTNLEFGLTKSFKNIYSALSADNSMSSLKSK